jgi:hypothetical protein
MDNMPPVETIMVPTLGEWGMIAMFAVPGMVGLFALRKRILAQSGNLELRSILYNSSCIL